MTTEDIIGHVIEGIVNGLARVLIGKILKSDEGTLTNKSKHKRRVIKRKPKKLQS